MKLPGINKRGFTLIELLVVVAILGILISIVIMSYNHYLDRAKRTVSISALETMRKMIESYAAERQSYPLSIDFTTCTDQSGIQVMPTLFCDQIKKDLFSIDSYITTGNTFTVTAKAIDSTHSVLTMSFDRIVMVAP
jgi:prepilin-type N-terminal cleavage/methylation domain-containing protein